MYLSISRLLCQVSAIVLSHCIVGFGTNSWVENSQEVVHGDSSHDSPTENYIPTAPLRSDAPIDAARDAMIDTVDYWRSAPQWQGESSEVGNFGGECLDLDGAHGGGLNDSNRATNLTDQHPAPEVVLRFSSGCTDAEFVNWKLSSRDKPCAKPAIPHGPLVVDILVDKQVDFVELMFDGKPLKPTTYANGVTLSYSVPCPAPGQHWLQARYLSGNIWSHYSKPIRFEVRLPPQPRIIAASDFDRDPTPLARKSITSITTHSIKVHLADVNRNDNIVAYIDGKPLPPHADSHVVGNILPVQTDSHLCCRVFKVEGAVIPGVHKLTVRVVGCSGACSITSEPSNAIAFHYYDEDIYLLRPGSGCINCANTDAPPHTATTSPFLPNSSSVGQEKLALKFDLKQKFVALVADTPAAEAARMVDVGQRFRDIAAADVASLKVTADLAIEHVSVTESASNYITRVRNTASVERALAAEYASEADRLSSQEVGLESAELETLMADAKAASEAALAADGRVQQVYEEIERSTETPRLRAESCRRNADATLKTHASAVELLRKGNEALAKAQAFANEARLAQDANNLSAAEQARLKTAVELGKIQTAQQAVAGLIALSRDQQLVATELRRLVSNDLTDVQTQLIRMQSETKAIAEKLHLTRKLFETAGALAIHLQDADLLAIRSVAASARAAHNNAAAAAQQALQHAAEAEELSKKAQSVAKSAQASTDKLIDKVANIAKARGAIDDAKIRAEAAVQKAYTEAAKYASNSTYGKVAKRIAVAAEEDLNAVRKAAAEATEVYTAALRQREGVAAYAGEAESHARSTLTYATAARRQAQDAADAQHAALKEAMSAEQWSTTHFEALKNKAVILPAWKNEASNARDKAEQRAREAVKYEADSLSSVMLARKSANLASDARDTASKVDKANERLEELKQIALSRTTAAESGAEHAGLTRKLQQQLTSITEVTEVAAMQDQLRSQIDNASHASSEGEIARAALATSQAEQAEARSDARIREYNANMRIARANSLTSPPSPFYFASAAHFPIRDFGLRGEPLDRDGVIIYEDMAFHFDREGNYEVHFRASSPPIPATVRLQFQIQPHSNGPWYTVTLAPIEFPYQSAKNDKSNCSGTICGEGDSKCSEGECCGKTRECVCKGHSEILRRCYGEMSPDAKIRRSGSARMGFGVKEPN